VICDLHFAAIYRVSLFCFAFRWHFSSLVKFNVEAERFSGPMLINLFGQIKTFTYTIKEL